MNISNVFSAYQAEQQYAVDSRKRESTVSEAPSNSRSAGPDTVTFSSEAMAMFQSMANGGGTASRSETSAQDSQPEDLFGRSHDSQKKKLDAAELLAFLKSDNFAEEAMGYAKAAATDELEEEEDELLEKLMQDIDSNRAAASEHNASAEGQEAAGNNAAESGLAGSGSGGKAFVGGKLVSEKELATEISKVEEEVQELTLSYEQIMAGEGALEEKVRLSQPVHKRLEDRLMDLQSLKAQAKELADQKDGMTKTG